MSQDLEIEKQDSTIDYYHERKNALMRAILQENAPVCMSEDEEPFCQVCKKRKSEVDEMHIEHPNGNGESKGNEGGWDKLYKYEDHFEEGRRLWVVCETDHYLLHKRREDKHAELLKRRMPYLQEYDDKDAEFLIRQRMKEGSIYG